MIKFRFIVLMMIAALLVACPSNPDAAKKNADGNGNTTDNGSGGNSGGKDTGKINPENNKIFSLQVVIDTTTDGAVINLSEYPNIDNYSATINKVITINGSADIDLSNSTLTVSRDNVTLAGLTNANVTTTAALGSGSLKISGSSLNSLNLQGGGANSIHLTGVTIKKAIADYKNVRLHIQDTATKIKSLIANQNCKIEDDMTSDTNTTAVVESLTIAKDAIAEVKTAVATLDVSGDNAEVLLSRANSYIGSFSSSINSNLLKSFRLTSIEKVDVVKVLNSLSSIVSADDVKKIQYKTSDCLVLGKEISGAYSDVSYNFDGFVKAWKHFNDHSTDNEEKRIWSNYANLRVLDKYNGKNITKLVPKAFQMCQWLDSIDIGENVKVIGNLAFLGCNNLRSLYVRPIEPPQVDGDMLFFTNDDTPTEDTKLDRSLFDPTSDFISAECIDYFIEWYKDSEYAGADGKQLVEDIYTVFDRIKEYCGVNSIGEFLKSEDVRILEPLIEDTVSADAKPTVIIDKIMAEWDKTICQTDMSKVTIYVPKGCLAAYQSAAVWSKYADRMVEAEDFSAIVHAE